MVGEGVVVAEGCPMRIILFLNDCHQAVSRRSGGHSGCIYLSFYKHLMLNLAMAVQPAWLLQQPQLLHENLVKDNLFFTISFCKTCNIAAAPVNKFEHSCVKCQTVTHPGSHFNSRSTLKITKTCLGHCVFPGGHPSKY